MTSFVSIDGRPVRSIDELSKAISGSVGRPLLAVVRRRGHLVNLTVTPVDGRHVTEIYQGVRQTYGNRPTGIIGVVLSTSRTQAVGPLAAVPKAGSEFGSLVADTGKGLAAIFSLHGLDSFFHQVRNAGNAPAGTGSGRGRLVERSGIGSGSSGGQIISFLGAIQIGAQAYRQDIGELLLLLAAINLFVGIVNMFPMLPLDGGHVAIAIYERIRSRRGRRYHADITKLMPVAYVFLAFIVVHRTRCPVLQHRPAGPPAGRLGTPGAAHRTRHGPCRRDRASPGRLRHMSRPAVMAPERRPTRQIAVGNVPVGGGAPISVQSMTITKTADVEGTLAQIYALAAAGADIVRCTCNEQAAAEGLARMVPRSPVPLVADVHFHHEMALAALEAGVQGLRLNPGNLRKPEEIKLVAAEARTGACPSASASTPARCTPSSTSASAVPRPKPSSSRPGWSWPTSRRSASTTSRSRSRPRTSRS